MIDFFTGILKYANINLECFVLFKKQPKRKRKREVPKRRTAITFEDKPRPISKNKQPEKIDICYVCAGRGLIETQRVNGKSIAIDEDCHECEGLGVLV